MRFVQMKTEGQLDMQTLHRARDRLVAERTALINQLRAILLERGISVPQGRIKLDRYLAILLENTGSGALTPRIGNQPVRFVACYGTRSASSGNTACTGASLKAGPSRLC